MKKLFIPYELAVIAKEKGFDEISVFGYGYFEGDLIQFNEGEDIGEFRNSDKCYGWVVAPLYQQVIDWLRDKHNIRFKIELTINGKIEIFISQIGWIFIGQFDNDYEAYNKAIEDALKLID